MRGALSIPPDRARELAALRQRVERLERVIADLQRAHGARDDADRALLRLLPVVTLQLPFTAHELLQHAHADLRLHQALADADIVSVDQCGTWLRRMTRMTDDGIVITRLPRWRWARRWRVTQVTPDVSGVDPR